jgi:predicted RNA-binding Zn-ribbon protein involved in translation (DUF1610 family)
MGKRVKLTCTECGAKLHVLKSRLGKERNCPKCGLTIVLDLESNRSTYDLTGGSKKKTKPQDGVNPRAQAGADWDDDDFAQQTADQPDQPHGQLPVLRRGVHREAGRTQNTATGSGGGGISLTNKPLLIVVGLIVCVLLGLLVHFVASYVGSNPPKPTETVLLESAIGAITIV